MEEVKQKLIAAGKRKTCIAKAAIVPGTGKVTINNIPYEHLNMFHRLMIKEPIDITKAVLGDFKFDVQIKTAGGGNESLIEASRLALAKAVMKISNSAELRKAMIEYDRNMLVADTRRKEPYKPGDSKARSKRQKSYR
jgi:small subunit ribosomal protein S9